MEEKIKALCGKITMQQQERLKKDKLDCESNLKNAVADYKIKNKYILVDVGTSGKYMIEKTTGNIYGIKAYGQIHRGHLYGTIDTIDDYYWGDYTAYKKAVQYV